MKIAERPGHNTTGSCATGSCASTCWTCCEAIEQLVADPSADLLAPLPHGEPGHTLLREALLLADPNAYPRGQSVVVRRALGAWPGE